MSTAICVYSGGLDSTVLLHECISTYEKVYAITFQYGQKHFKEVDVASKYIKKLNNSKIVEHKFLDLSFFKNVALNSSITNDSISMPTMKDIVGHPQPTSYVPNRNMMLLSIAASYAESVNANDIVYGAVAVDNFSYWDCTEEFVQNINNTLHLNRMHTTTVHAPLLYKTKKNIVELGVQNGVRFEDTWTCYEGGEVACGICPSCSSRIAGFKQAKVVDPIKYAVNIEW